jgi:hypothetical protein
LVHILSLNVPVVFACSSSFSFLVSGNSHFEVKAHNIHNHATHQAIASQDTLFLAISAACDTQLTASLASQSTTLPSFSVVFVGFSILLIIG